MSTGTLRGEHIVLDKTLVLTDGQKLFDCHVEASDSFDGDSLIRVEGTDVWVYGTSLQVNHRTKCAVHVPVGSCAVMSW